MAGVEFWGWENALQLILLDVTNFSQQVPENLRDIKNENKETNQELSDLLADKFDDEFRVFILATFAFLKSKNSNQMKRARTVLVPL